MEASTLIRKIHMNCPLCDKIHEVEERKRDTTMTVKGEEVAYEEKFYFCANADEDEAEFESGSMTNKNLLNARNAYRVKKGDVYKRQLQTGANDVYVIDGKDGKEYLFPAIKQCILKVDLEAQEIIVHIMDLSLIHIWLITTKDYSATGGREKFLPF